MQKLERLKPYKEKSPLVTIQQARQILADNDIFVIESSHKREPLTGVCSCRVILGDEGLRDLNIGTNGKGMDARYALASAYGELMERLENGALLWKVLGVPHVLPGSITVGKEEYQEAVMRLMRFAFDDAPGIDEAVAKIVEATEDYNVFSFREYATGEELVFPSALYNRMTGSNGMSAGNTFEEAVIQGLSEIFERAALEVLFLDKVTPPAVPEEYFENTEVLRRLKKLATRGVRYRIIDCSLGRGLPVLGLMAERDGKYHLQLGADPSPITALERCLTEMFQGRTIEELPLLPPLDSSANLYVLFRNEEKEYTDSTGQVPVWITDGAPTYEFSGFPHPVTVSDSEDLKYYFRILSNLGKKLYVKDFGGLGFPAVRVYVPGMTENHCPEPEYCLEKKIPEDIRSQLLLLPALTDSEYEALALGLQEWLRTDFGISDLRNMPEGDFAGIGRAFPAGGFIGRKWEDRLTVAAIFIRGGLKEEGSAILEEYIKDSAVSEGDADLLRLRLNSRMLTFVSTQWPQCPDCEKCLARQICCDSEVRRFDEKTMALMSKQKKAIGCLESE